MAKLDLTKPLVLVNKVCDSKYPARVICTDRKDRNCPVVALFTINGREDTITMGVDFTTANWWLENVPERRSTFQNVYDDSCVADEHKSREKADGVAKGAVWKRIAVIERIYEDRKIVDVVVHKDV